MIPCKRLFVVEPCRPAFWIVALAIFCLACGKAPGETPSQVTTVSPTAATEDAHPGRLPTADSAPPSLPSPDVRHLSGDVVIDGSSTVFPITEAVAVRLAEEAPQLRVQLGVSGTGGGFDKFCRGKIDIADASRPIKVAETQRCAAAGIEFVEIPIGFDGISVVVHGANDWARCITSDELKRLWQPQAEGRISTWKQVREAWPEEAIHLYAPGSDSGTFDYFTHAIVGREGSSRRDVISSEDDYLLAQKISHDPHALGFFGYAYFSEYKSTLRLVAVDSGAGCVQPSATTIHDGAYSPLARPVFLYVAVAALERPEVMGFIDYFLSHAEELVVRAGYVPLPPSGYGLMQRRVSGRHRGSIFSGGSQTGVSISELLRRENADQQDPS